MECQIDYYPETLTMLYFEHSGQNIELFRGHFGTKMAGAVVRFVFDSIKPFQE